MIITSRQSATPDQRSQEPLPVERVEALDVMRGALVAAMILVNSTANGHATLQQLQHVRWQGITVAEVVAPGFLWIVGVSASLSLHRRSSTHPRSRPLRHIAIRALKIFLIGVLIPLVPAALANPQSSLLDSLKLAGILQRLSLSYLLAAPIILLWSGRQLMLVALVMLTAWLGYMLCIPGPLPGGGAFDPLTNAAQRPDAWLLGQFAETSSHALPTVIPAAILMLFGSSCASVLLGASDRRSKQLTLLILGMSLVALGVALGSSVPYVRRILSPSFVLVTAGSCTVLFAILYEAIDIRRTRVGTLPFIALSANAIVIFAASEILRAFAGMVGSARPTGHWESLWDLSSHVLERQLPAAWAGFLMSLAYLAAFSMLAVFLYRRDLTFHV